jgi:hypothetical protein
MTETQRGDSMLKKALMLQRLGFIGVSAVFPVRHARAMCAKFSRH